MPRPGELPIKEREHLTFESMPWLNEVLGKGLVRGGTYLTAGEPGIGKSTLMIQTLADLAHQGEDVLYLSTEQGIDSIERTLERTCSNRAGRLPQAIRDHFYMEDRLKDIAYLSSFLEEQVLDEYGSYQGVSVIALDSIHGQGLASTAAAKYRSLFQFAERAKLKGITTLLVGHVTKAGQIAGPKTLEHNVDCLLYMRRAYRLRPLFVPKNRFGPARFEPLILAMDAKGRLARSRQAQVQCSAVLGFTAGAGLEFVDVQASVGLPKLDNPPILNTPDLPRQKMRQLVRLLGEMKEIDLAELSYEVRAYIPGRTAYSSELDLPLAVALVAAYLHQPVPPKTLFVGELDLMRRVRPLEDGYIEALAKAVSGRSGAVRRIYVSDQSARRVAECSTGHAIKVENHAEVKGVADLEGLLRELWPAMLGV
jgi:DNA repair protein RadA/Sms